VTEYRCSTFSMNSCALALVALACSTRVTIRATTESDAGRLTRICRAPWRFKVPANTSSPGSRSTGSGSPVMLAWSTSLTPDTTLPSAPTRSPGRTTIRSPTISSAVSTTRSVPSGASSEACSGARVSSARTLSAVRLVA